MGVYVFILLSCLFLVFIGGLVAEEQKIWIASVLSGIIFSIVLLFIVHEEGKQSVLRNSLQSQKAVLLQEKESLEQRMLELSEELKEFEEEK